MKQLLKKIGVGKLLQAIEVASPWLFAIPAVFIYAGLFVFKILSGKQIKFVFIYCGRIGHLAAETELFLRRLNNGIYNPNNIYIGLCGVFPVVNHQLLQMFRRHMIIIVSWWLHKLIILTWLRKTQFFHVASHKSFFSSEHYEFNHNEYYELNNYKQVIRFTNAEEQLGEKQLEKIGIGKKDWFVCIHARDRIYLNEVNGRNDYRNCDIETFMSAAEYVVSEGGYVFRMGAKVEKPLPKDRNRKIIDFAVENYSDFMDVYLSTHCKFFIGSATGLANVPTIFGVPIVLVNEGPFECVPFRQGDLYIPKLYYHNGEKRFLKTTEILEFGLGRSLINNDLGKPDWLHLVDNTAEEILEVVKEMNLRLDNKYQQTPDDEKNQAEFWSNFKPGHIAYGTPAKIGTHFLQKYSNILLNNE
jgi:putative glycosyltransferase (TIGR04372 family)